MPTLDEAKDLGNTINELIDRDPVSLTDDDTEKIVGWMRQFAKNWEEEEKKPKGVKRKPATPASTDINLLFTPEELADLDKIPF